MKICVGYPRTPLQHMQRQCHTLALQASQAVQALAFIQKLQGNQRLDLVSVYKSKSKFVSTCTVIIVLRQLKGPTCTPHSQASTNGNYHYFGEPEQFLKPEAMAPYIPEHVIHLLHENQKGILIKFNTTMQLASTTS